jgi:hypothetical protein
MAHVVILWEGAAQGDSEKMMNKSSNNKLALVLALGMFGFVGCSAKVSGGNPGPIDIPLSGGNLPAAQPSQAAAQPAQPPQPAQGPATVLEGQWKVACSPVTGMNLYTEGEADFSGPNYETISAMYADPQCSVTVFPQDKETGTFTIPAAGEINMIRADGTAQFNVFEIDASPKALYVGLQPGIAEEDRPQAVDKSLTYLYAGPAVLSH